MTARLATKMVAASGAVLAILIGTSGAAHAVPGSNSVAETLTFVGSDTTQFFDEQFCADINANSYANNPLPTSGKKDTCSNIFAFPATGFPTSETSPADAYAPACTWVFSPTTAPGCPGGSSEVTPTGSGAGNTRLLLAAGGSTVADRAVVDVGRASSDQCTGKGVSTETCYAYGRDAVGFATYKAGGNSSTYTLTVAQIQSIYNCTYTNWSQVTGSGHPAGVITRYFPQSGSGTGSFFVTNFLGGSDPRTTSYTACGGISVPAANQVAENDATSVPSASRANAIIPFSAGSYIAQVVDQPGAEVPNTIGTTGLKLGTVKIGSMTLNPVTNPGSTSPTPNNNAYKEGSTYPGARYIYHDVDTRLTSYQAAMHFIGTDSTGKSALCNNANGSTAGNLIKNRLKQYGFTSLPVQSSNPTFWGTCRVFPGP